MADTGPLLMLSNHLQLQVGSKWISGVDVKPQMEI